METSFSAGDLVRFESGKEYRVLEVTKDGQLEVRGRRGGQDFGSVRTIDPARTKLVKRAADSPVTEALPIVARAAVQEPAPSIQGLPDHLQPAARTSYWDTIAQAETTLHRTIQAARLGMEVKDAVDRIVTALAEGAKPDPDDYEPIRRFVDHIDGL